MEPILRRYVLGPLENNSFLLADPLSKEAAIIDPSFDPEVILEEAKEMGLRIGFILLTHAHFDHIAGVARLAQASGLPVQVALHPLDLALYQQGGGAAAFRFPMEKNPEPDVLLAHGQVLRIGSLVLEVRHTPGHTPGHVIFVCQQAELVFCGDLIFAGSVGRTDLPGGNHAQLLHSIRQQVLTLDEMMRLLPGHGEETCVGAEEATNPYLN